MAIADPHHAVSTARSMLFVPGDRPERFDKAVATGADLVILDLEDAVAPEAKAGALAHVLAWLGEGHHAVVRVNAAGTRRHDDEIAALSGTGATIMLPKSESADDLIDVVARLGSAARVVALVETARGVRDIDAICAVTGVVRAAIGNVDLSTELGVEPTSHAALAYARGRLVIASAAAGLPAPVDGVTTDLGSPEALAHDLAHGRELGFGAKLCIHPRQVEAVNRGFSPTESELRWARRVLDAAGDGAGGAGVRVLDGKMIDAPVVRRAELLVAKERH